MQESKVSAKKITSGVAWSFAERIAAQVVSTVVSIILARLLEPEHYGIISIVMIFISVCNIFVSDGFGKVLVQKAETQKVDFDSMFWLGLSVSVFLYLILFCASPSIEKFYGMEKLSAVIRVLGIRLILVSVNTIQQAYVQREMAFKKFFFATFFGTVVSAVVGIALAYKGFGIWALVAQYLTNTTIDTAVLFFTCGWRPGFQFSYKRIRGMLPFTIRVLAQTFIFTFQDNIRSLIIGKKFSSADLAFYEKGRQFPQLIITNLNASVSKVMLPAVALNQHDLTVCKKVIRKAITVGLFLLCPAMLGFCAIGDTFVSIVLTDKWLFAVPYLRIFCIAFLIRPFETAASSSLLAIGRSDITLRNMIWINITALTMTFIAVFYFESVFVIALGTVASEAVSILLYSYYLQKCFDYRLKEQLYDCLPFVISGSLMAVAVWLLHFVIPNKAVAMCVQILVGAGIYILIAVIFKMKEFYWILDYCKRFLHKKR